LAERGAVERRGATEVRGVRGGGAGARLRRTHLPDEDRLRGGERLAPDLAQAMRILEALDVARDHARARVADQVLKEIERGDRSFVSGGRVAAKAEALGVREHQDRVAEGAALRCQAHRALPIGPAVRGTEAHGYALRDIHVALAVRADE